MQKKLSSNFFIVVVALVVLVQVVSVVAAMMMRPSMVGSKAIGNDKSPQVTELNAQINEYEKMLKDNSLTDEARNSLQEKLTMAQHQLELYTQLSADIGGEPDAKQAEIPILDDPNFETGIFEGDGGMFRPEVAVIQNYYQTQYGDQYIQAYAGAVGTDKSQGIVILAVTSIDKMETTFEQFLTPVNEGYVRIENVDNHIIFLITESQNHLSFRIREKVFE